MNSHITLTNLRTLLDHVDDLWVIARKLQTDVITSNTGCTARLLDFDDGAGLRELLRSVVHSCETTAADSLIRHISVLKVFIRDVIHDIESCEPK